MKTHRAPHTRIDNRVFNYMDEIGTNGFAIYAVLKKHENRHNGRAWPSYQTIANITGLDRKTVIKYTLILFRLRLITKMPHFIDGRQTSNRYSIPDYPKPENKGGGNVQPPQDRGDGMDSRGGTAPPQPLFLNQRLTKKQKECAEKGHKTIVRPVDGYAYCSSCYLTIEDDGQQEGLGTTPMTLPD